MTTLRDVATNTTGAQTADEMAEHLDQIFRNHIIAVVDVHGAEYAKGWLDSIQSVIRSLKESNL